MSTDKNNFLVDAKRVIGMQCNGLSKKEKNDKQWSKKNYTENLFLIWKDFEQMYYEWHSL
jgi:hypothetical protein